MTYTLQVQRDGVKWETTSYATIRTLAQASQLLSYYAANWPQFQYRLTQRVTLPGESV